MPSFSTFVINQKRQILSILIILLLLLVSASKMQAQAGDYSETRVGTIDSDNAGDWWTFDGQEGWHFSITLSRTSGNLDPMLWLLDEDNEVLVSNDDFAGSLNSYFFFGLPYTGEYTVVVGDAAGNDVTNEGRYKLSVYHFPGGGGAGPGARLYLSSSTSGTAGSVSYRDEDILIYGSGTDRWEMYFDGSDVGLGGSNADIDALAVITNDFLERDDDRILLSLDRAYDVPGVGLVDDSDILLFTPTRLGTSTAGEFTLLLDGSDLGLTSNQEDIDALNFTETSDSFSLVLSTKGAFQVSDISGQGQDLLLFDPEKTGPNSAGRWKLYFDGSDAGLSKSAENIAGLSISQYIGGGDVNFMTTEGIYAVTGQDGDGNDVFNCSPQSLSYRTRCYYGSDKFWDGSIEGLSGGFVDALYVDGL